MEGEVLNLIAKYGLEAALLAIAINVLTGLIKLPVKAWAKKLEDGTKLTRYLVFLPVALGFVLTVVYVKIRFGEVAFDKGFMTLWLTASSLSLTLYAVFEKMFPAKEKVLKDYEIEANEKLLEEIRKLAGMTAEKPEEEKKELKKIVLGGKRNEGTETEKEQE